MDTTSFSSYLLPIAVLLLPLSFFLFYFLSTSDISTSKNHPPGSNGWPVLGENVEFALAGPENFVIKRMNKFSPNVFLTSLKGEKMAIFSGPGGNKFIFTNETKLLTRWLPKFMKKAFHLPDCHDQHSMKDVARSFHTCLHEALRPEALKQYIPIMDTLAREHVDKYWSPHEQVKVFPLSKIYTFVLACKLLMGIDDPEQVARLMKNFSIFMNGLYSIPIDFPGTAFNGAIKVGKLVHEELVKIMVTRKKETMGLGRDIMSQLSLVSDGKGQSFNELISTFIMGLLVASFDTTSSAVTFVLKHLAEHPHIYKQVLREQMEISESKGPGELLNWEDIQKMTYSWNVVRESLRLFPPGQGGSREAITDFTFAGFTIPKGWKIFWNVFTTHKNPNYFPNPEIFDPSRFEGNGPQPYTFVPFGGGPHMCPGKEYARLEILVFVHNVVKNFMLEKLIPDEKVVYKESPIPANGLPVRLHRHDL